MNPSVLDHLVCPVDKGPLTLEIARQDGTEVLDGVVRCGAGHQYPISGGVARMLPPGSATAPTRPTAESFSAKWKRIPDFGHDEASRAVYVDWYLQRFGFGTLDGLRSFLAGRSLVLDAGTGLGRDALLYGRCSTAQVFGVDISDSVEFAYEHVRHQPNVHIVQADLTALPFPEGTFDYLACDQVLHHTPDTAASFSHLVDHLAPDGEIAVYVYKRKGPVREFCDDFLRAHYTRSSEEECLEFSRAMTLLGKALSDLHVEVDVPADIPILGIQAGRQDLQRFVYWNVFKCYWNDRLDFDTNVMTNFDWYHPEHAHRHTPEEVSGWCAAAGLEVTNFDVVESGISVRARRPAEEGR